MAELQEAHPGISRMNALARGYANMDGELRKCCEELFLIPVTPESPSGSTSSLMGVAWTTMV